MVVLGLGALALGCPKQSTAKKPKGDAVAVAKKDAGTAKPAVDQKDATGTPTKPDAGKAADAGPSKAAADAKGSKDANAGDATTAAANDAAADVDLSPVDSRVEGVQPMRFPLKAFSPEDQEKAIEAIRRAARLVRKGKFGKAIDGYQTALALDANSWSRYELMTTYLRAGEIRPALAMLKELREWADSKFECLICKVWLKKSTGDKLFAKVHEDPRYKKLVDGLKFEEPNYEAMARKFLLEVENKEKAMMKASLERQMTIRIADATKTVDAKTGKQGEWVDEVTHFSKFEEIEKAVLTKYDEPKSIRCSSRCCRLRYPKKKAVAIKGAEAGKKKAPVAKEDAKGKRGESKAEPCDFNRLERICFWPFGKEEVAIIRLDQRLCEVKPMGMDDLIDRVGKPGWQVPGAKKKGADDPNAERPPGKPTYQNPPENL